MFFGLTAGAGLERIACAVGALCVKSRIGPINSVHKVRRTIQRNSIMVAPSLANGCMEVRTLRVSIGTTECADSYESQSSCQSAFRCGELPHFIGAKDDTQGLVHRFEAPTCCQAFTVCASIVRCWN